MLQSLITRALVMIAEGAAWIEAIQWVSRRLPANLQTYYREEITAGLIKEVTL